MFEGDDLDADNIDDFRMDLNVPEHIDVTINDENDYLNGDGL